MTQEEVKEYSSFYWQRKYQRDTNFQSTNNFFILAVTFIVISFANLITQNQTIILIKPLLAMGLSITALWLLMNLYFFYSDYQSVNSYFNKLGEKSLPLSLYLKRNLLFIVYIGIPIMFLGFLLIMTYNFFKFHPT
jgi:hypothetical protein